MRARCVSGVLRLGVFLLRFRPRSKSGPVTRDLFSSHFASEGTAEQSLCLFGDPCGREEGAAIQSTPVRLEQVG